MWNYILRDELVPSTMHCLVGCLNLCLPFAHIIHLWSSVIFTLYRYLLFLLLTPAPTVGHLLYGSSLLGSYLTFPVPILQKCRKFEIRLHCNDHSWCSPALCACGCQCGVWIWHIFFFTYGMRSSCTRCWFLYRRIVWRIWSCDIRNSAGTCLLDVGEGRTSLQLHFS